LKARLEWLDEENHRELGMDNRLFNVYDVQSFFKEELSDLRDNPNPILPDH
jgi:hypothetical protein